MVTALKPISENGHRPPPEPGFARREAQPHARKRTNTATLHRLTDRLTYVSARKEGVHGGTRGSPVKRVEFAT